MTSRQELVAGGDRPVEGRTAAARLASLTGAVGLALVAPLALLGVGLPVVLVVRALVEVGQWLFAGGR